MLRRPDPEWMSTARTVAARWSHLDAGERDRLLAQAQRLDRTRTWEGLDGLTVTPEMRALITVQACLLTVNIGVRVLRDVTSILVAPSATTRTTRHRTGPSIITESNTCVLGETLMHGPIRVAWDQVLAEQTRRAETSVVIHEFAHKVDMADGDAGGTPPIAGREASFAFERTAETVFGALRDGMPSRSLRPYAATNRVELFAVATEAFFLQPTILNGEHPDLYRVLAAFYRQDPAALGSGPRDRA